MQHATWRPLIGAAIILGSLALTLAPGCSKKDDKAAKDDPAASEPAGGKAGAPAGEPVEEKTVKKPDGATLHVAAITSKGQVKSYPVKAGKGKLVELELTNAPATSSPVDYVVELKAPNKQRVTRLRDTNGSDGTTRLKSRAYLAEEGDYTLTVSDHGDDEVDPAGFKLTVRLLDDPDKNEPNNGGNLDTNKALATEITPGEPVEGMIEYRADEDWYKFTAKKNTILEVQLTNAPATSSLVDYTVSMWPDSGTERQWRERDTNGSDGTTVHKTRRYIREDGTYYLQVFDWGDEEYEDKQGYKLTVNTLEDPDPTEPNSGGNLDGHRTLAKALKSGEPVEAMLEYEGDQDWFKIAADKGKLIQIKLDNTPATSSQVDYTLQLYDWKEGDRLWRVRDTNGSDGTTILETSRPAPGKGDYFVQVFDWADDEYETSGTYKLTVTIVDSPDKNEPNQGDNFDTCKTMATALPRGKSVTGYIDFHDDSDWFAIDHKGGQLVVNLTNAPATSSAVDLTMRLRNDADEELARERDTDGTDGTTQLSLKKELPAGKYYLQIFDWADDDFGLDQSYSVCFGAPAKPVK